MQLAHAGVPRARSRERVINVHPSLLPAFPGLGAIEQAIDYGAKVTGVTVHFVDEGVDTGAIIFQRALEIGDDDRRRRRSTTACARSSTSCCPRRSGASPRAAVAFDPANPRRVVVG